MPRGTHGTSRRTVPSPCAAAARAARSPSATVPIARRSSRAVSVPEPDRPHRGGRAPGTRAVHAGLPAPAQGEPFLPGPVFAGPYHLSGEADAHRYGYHRYGNPTWTYYEAALGELEGGEAVVFPSGMTAVTAILLSVLEPGDVFVAPSDAYPGVRDVAASHLVPMGVDVRLVPTDEQAIRDALPGAKLVWVEVPSNPGLDVIDLVRLSADVHEAGALLAVDNTL